MVGSKVKIAPPVQLEIGTFLPSSIIYYILRSLMHMGEDPQTEKLGVLEGLSERCLPSVIQLLFQPRCWGCTPQVPSQPRPGKTVAWILKSIILWYNNKYLVCIPVLAPSFRNSCSCPRDQPCGIAFVMLIWKVPGSLKDGVTRGTYHVTERLLLSVPPTPNFSWRLSLVTAASDFISQVCVMKLP